MTSDTEMLDSKVILSSNMLKMPMHRNFDNFLLAEMKDS